VGGVQGGAGISSPPGKRNEVRRGALTTSGGRELAAQMTPHNNTHGPEAFDNPREVRATESNDEEAEGGCSRCWRGGEGERSGDERLRVERERGVWGPELGQFEPARARQPTRGAGHREQRRGGGGRVRLALELALAMARRRGREVGCGRD
jgi:hypothetical protein